VNGFLANRRYEQTITAAAQKRKPDTRFKWRTLAGKQEEQLRPSTENSLFLTHNSRLAIQQIAQTFVALEVS
jgi:hypothetical protein